MSLFGQLNSLQRQRLRQWFFQTPGKLFEQSGQEQLANILPGLFGYHLLQLGDYSGNHLLNTSAIPHCVLIDNERLVCSPCYKICAEPQNLPIATDSVDVIVLPHTLEFCADPHQVLREIDRILIPEGHVVICGFNPWSFMGLWRLILRYTEKPPWCGRFLGLVRVKDWLALLGFDTVMVKPHFFKPPLRHDKLLKRLAWMEALGARWWPALAGGYILVARKRVATLTPIKPRWRPRRSLMTPGMVKPTTLQSKKHE